MLVRKFPKRKKHRDYKIFKSLPPGEKNWGHESLSPNSFSIFGQISLCKIRAYNEFTLHSLYNKIVKEKSITIIVGQKVYSQTFILK